MEVLDDDGLGVLLADDCFELPDAVFCELLDDVLLVEGLLDDCVDAEGLLSLADGTYLLIVMDDIFLFSLTLEDILKFSFETRPSL